MGNGETEETKHSLAADEYTRVRLALCMKTSPTSVISYFGHKYILASEGLLEGGVSVCRTAEQRGTP